MRLCVAGERRAEGGETRKTRRKMRGSLWGMCKWQWQWRKWWQKLHLTDSGWRGVAGWWKRKIHGIHEKNIIVVINHYYLQWTCQSCIVSLGSLSCRGPAGEEGNLTCRARALRFGGTGRAGEVAWDGGGRRGWVGDEKGRVEIVRGGQEGRQVGWSG